MNLVFFGSDPISLPLLDWLRDTPPAGSRLVGVVSQPDRPKGRGKKLAPNEISAWALANNIELLRPEKPGTELEDWLRSHDIALALVMAYGHILKKSLLATPPLGFVNFHASLLPAYRGASPIETSVANGEAETGVSLMRIIPKMDAGAVCDAERVAIEHNDTGGSMREKLAVACVPLIERGLPALLEGRAEFTEQDAEAVTYCRKLVKADGALDFNAKADELAARINGLFPWPGGFCDYQGTRLKVKSAVAETGHGAPGEILAANVDGLTVACGEGAIRIYELQRPAGKMLSVGDFLRGFPLDSGTFLDGGELTKLVSKAPFPRHV
ncbi:methionyl-tRNA formyltransferase [Cerasicoccus arenae]|uniref:Methionyl-tRNA formyltransferase n=1 Tax=Cerasicoccus arenae TaxID=424488 RepID=A0A8J3DI55_9BACT|nr:methionyl-tRNA formyltransferase [Cerasicoccus arenae]MBK1857535.1 methionyl-tRNA formyltransferase [Cerasicoccus arenae]GHB95576.1 methionyl-tRNA formyltransferase [Cerasicoccus arenae]